MRSLPAAGSQSTWSTPIVPRTRVVSANGQPTRVLLGEGVNESGYCSGASALPWAILSLSAGDTGS